ncbi:MAG: DUF6782 family putative metallopeptidase [Alphaproteobacteria bacterium]
MDSKAKKCLKNKLKYKSNKLKVKGIDENFEDQQAAAENYEDQKEALYMLRDLRDGALYIGKRPSQPIKPTKPVKPFIFDENDPKSQKKLEEYEKKLADYNEHKEEYEKKYKEDMATYKKDHNEYICKTKDLESIESKTVKIRSLLWNKGVREAIKKIQETLNKQAEAEYKEKSQDVKSAKDGKSSKNTEGPKYFRIAFDDTLVYRKHPKEPYETDILEGHYSREDRTIYLPRFTKKYTGGSEYIEYFKDCELDEKNYPEDFDFYAKMLPVLFTHELRHAVQHANGISYKDDENLKAWFIKDRVMEADADAFAAYVAYDLESKYEDIEYFTNAKKTDKKDIFETFENARRGTDNGVASKAAFKAWFNSDERKDSYESKMIKKLSKVSRDHILFLYKELDVEKLLKDSALYLEGGDMAKFVLRDENCGIRKKTADEIVQIFPFIDDVKKQAYDLATRDKPQNNTKNIAFMNAKIKHSR